MEIFRIITYIILIFSSAFLANAKEGKLQPCNYPAIYNFGDSNSDTGGIAAAFSPPKSPNGETYFRRPAGRFSDGRLVVDFIAGHLDLPYLSPYLDPIGSNFRHGANFATAGATITQPTEFASGLSPFYLDIQVEQYTQFKARTTRFYNDKKTLCRKMLPRPQDFTKALFMIDIGQNDLTFELQKKDLPNLVRQFSKQVKTLYRRRARTFWIHNAGPVGCLPFVIVKMQDPVLDEHGCVKSQNEKAVEFNKLLKNEIVKLRLELSQAMIVHVDMYSAKLDLITNAKHQGFEDAFKICCGHHGIGYDVWCGNRGNVSGSRVFSGSCSDPTRVISWDGVHYTEAANNWIATRIMNGSLSDPPIPISRACHEI